MTWCVVEVVLFEIPQEDKKIHRGEVCQNRSTAFQQRVTSFALFAARGAMAMRPVRHARAIRPQQHLKIIFRFTGFYFENFFLGVFDFYPVRFG